MSALAEALVAAQARAVSTIGKQFLAEKISYDEATDLLKTCGCGDEVELEYLLACWSAIRAAGAQAPSEQKPSQNGPDRSKATDAQISLMEKLAKERNYTMPDDAKLLSRDHASQIIDNMKAGEYDYAEWRVAF